MFLTQTATFMLIAFLAALIPVVLASMRAIDARKKWASSLALGLYRPPLHNRFLRWFFDWVMDFVL